MEDLIMSLITVIAFEILGIFACILGFPILGILIIIATPFVVRLSVYGYLFKSELGCRTPMGDLRKFLRDRARSRHA
jgi:hypothetical protein